MATDTPPDRDPEGNLDRPGRSGPEVGDSAGGEGAEFAGDAGRTDPESPAERSRSWRKAHGESPAEP